jgi:ATP-binding protein involved in chromosome partitioning
MPSVPGIKNIIAIGSGKGGVGKSTTAVNVALALQLEGYTVGILDADIYGPNQPLLLGLEGVSSKPTIAPDQRLKPIMQYGLQSMSIGYLLDEQAPVVWRGPMISKALEQMLYQTAWQALDYLIIDLPPGTGDITLTVAQKMLLNGVVIVTTPQKMAVLDAHKALSAFKKLHVPLVGVIENMSTHRCTACGHQEAIFGEEGGEKLALEFKVPLLGRLPLRASICAQADSGKPTVMAEPAADISLDYRAIARQLVLELKKHVSVVRKNIVSKVIDE